MSRLEDLTFPRRILLTIIVVLMILFALAAFGYFTGGWEAQGQYRIQSAIPGEPASTWDTRMFALDRDALDEAYKDYLKKLFTTMLNAGDVQASDRAVVGAKNMRRVYIKVMEAIDMREKASQEEMARKRQEQP